MFTRPRIIPVLLIDDRDLVKTVKFSDPTYLGDPVNAVKIFNIKGVDELSVLDISATRRGIDPDFAFLEDIASEAFMPLSYGGGVRTVEQAGKLFRMGYEKVVLNTALAENPCLVTEVATLYGSQSVVASIDAKIADGVYRCAVHDGDVLLELSPVEMARRAEELGAGEIFLNSIDRDGTMSGYDTALVREISDAVDVPVIACGGAKDVFDMKDVIHNAHAHAAAGGSMFVYYGRLKAVLIQAPTEKELYESGVYA